MWTCFMEIFFHPKKKIVSLLNQKGTEIYMEENLLSDWYIV